jgi:hypothetical protein
MGIAFFVEDIMIPHGYVLAWVACVRFTTQREI